MQRFAVAVGLGRADGILGRLHVASPAIDIGAQKGSRIVLQLLLHGVVELHSLDHRMGRAGVGAGSHRSHIGSFQEEESRRSGPASGRGNIHDDGDRRGDDLAHHLPHGIEQAAGCIDFDQDGARVLRRGRIQPALHVVGADGLNGVVDVDQDHPRLLPQSGDGPAPDRGKQQGKSPPAVHGTGCPLLSSCCFSPRAVEFCGSSLSALATSAAAAGF